jgi:hypothetical protein
MRTRHTYIVWIALTLAAVLACDHGSLEQGESDMLDPITCGGLLGLKCPEGLICVDDGGDDCDPDHDDAQCFGFCQPEKPIYCGGIAGFQCPKGQPCFDDPTDDCDPEDGGADCIGICHPPPIAHCGGVIGLPCPKEQLCVDDPYDDCDPARGDLDCIGICEDQLILAAPAGGPRWTH